MDVTKNLTPKHLFFVLLTVVIWGTNFIAIYLGLKEMPPFLFCTIRFALSALPFVFFIPKPKAPLKFIIGFGFFNFALQFGLLFSGIQMGLSPGLASLVMQIQVFFSMGLAIVLFKEKPNWFKIAGSLVSFIGIGIIAKHVGGDVTTVGLLLTLMASMAWASGNMFTKKINAVSPLSLVVWGNFTALPFMAVTSYYFDGLESIVKFVHTISWTSALAIFYVVYISTHIGYGLWGFLIKTYPTSAVVPFTLLIPIVGFLSAALFLNEQLTDWKLYASFFIMIGLVFNLFENKISKWMVKPKT